MPSITHNPCSELVLSWLPFPPTPEQEVLIEQLCANGVNPKLIVWLVFLILLGPELKEPSDPGKLEKPTPWVQSTNFQWDLWSIICAWIQKQSLNLSSDIAEQVFLQVLAGQILTLKEASDLIYSLVASAYDGGSGARDWRGGTRGPR